MTPLLTNEEAQRLAQYCGYSGSPSEITTIARLWGGMGQVYRVRWGKEKAMIVKWVDLQQADPTDRGDRRKLESYTVEVNFYRCHSKELQTKNGVALPTYLYAEHDKDRTILCLSELRSTFHRTDHHRNVLDWLARFHAATWQFDSNANLETYHPVQPRGTYWHLDTRPDEWQDMRKHGWVGRLRLAARPIDSFLRSSTLQSWVHGDTKEANVLRAADEDVGGIAMCDFQYVGPGCPLQDVCYFLCSSGVSDDDDALVDYYFAQLESYLNDKNQQHLDRKMFDFMLEVCYADYMRFMCGWGQWGSDISRRVMAWLDTVDGGRQLETEGDYEQAIQKAFDKATQGK